MSIFSSKPSFSSLRPVFASSVGTMSATASGPSKRREVSLRARRKERRTSQSEEAVRKWGEKEGKEGDELEREVLGYGTKQWEISF